LVDVVAVDVDREDGQGCPRRRVMTWRFESILARSTGLGPLWFALDGPNV
jgi:hypothetical protein